MHTCMLTHRNAYITLSASIPHLFSTFRVTGRTVCVCMHVYVCMYAEMDSCNLKSAKVILIDTQVRTHRHTHTHMLGH